MFCGLFEILEIDPALAEAPTVAWQALLLHRLERAAAAPHDEGWSSILRHLAAGADRGQFDPEALLILSRLPMAKGSEIQVLAAQAVFLSRGILPHGTPAEQGSYRAICTRAAAFADISGERVDLAGRIVGTAAQRVVANHSALYADVWPAKLCLADVVALPTELEEVTQAALALAEGYEPALARGMRAVLRQIV